MNYYELTNEELCLLAKKGNEEALGVLYIINKGFLINQILNTEAEYKIRITDRENFLQLGFIGIWKAVEHYDSNKGAGFLTYAAYWIRREMFAEAEKIINSPREVFWAVDLNGASDTIEDEFRADPAEKHGRRKLFNIYGNPENVAIWNMMCDELEKSFYRLNERNRALVDARYGYTTGKPLTYRKISQKYHMFVRKAKEGVHIGLKLLRYDMCRLYHKRRLFEKLLGEIRETCSEISRLKCEQSKRVTAVQNEKIIRTEVSEKLKESA